jgi:hypothetical protein
MKRVIWLKTARVSGHNPDNTAKVERITNKLEDGDNFNKFIRYLNLKGLMTSEPPTIEKVMENQDGKWVVINPQPWIEKLKEALVVVPDDAKTDFKLLSEKQAKEIESLKVNNQSFEERLKALESNKEENIVLKNQDGEIITGKDEVPILRASLETKANELGIKFRENIGNDKLIAKIIEVEPEFKA